MLPLIFQLILINETTTLNKYLSINPDKLNKVFKDNSTLQFAVKHKSYNSIWILLNHHAPLNIQPYEETVLPLREGDIFPSQNDVLTTSFIEEDVAAVTAFFDAGHRFTEVTALLYMLETVIMFQDNIRMLELVIYYYPDILNVTRPFNSDFSALHRATALKAKKYISYILNLRRCTRYIFNGFTSPFRIAALNMDLTTVKKMYEITDFYAFDHVETLFTIVRKTTRNTKEENIKNRIIEILLSKESVNVTMNGLTLLHVAKGISTLRVIYNHNIIINRDVYNRLPSQTKEAEGRLEEMAYLQYIETATNDEQPNND